MTLLVSWKLQIIIVQYKPTEFALIEINIHDGSDNQILINVRTNSENKQQTLPMFLVSPTKSRSTAKAPVQEMVTAIFCD